jgi:hypothetical protein
MFLLQVAQAPKASTPQVQAISELELDQAWVPAQPGRNTDINLSLLTSCLLPSAQVGRAESYSLGHRAIHTAYREEWQGQGPKYSWQGGMGRAGAKTEWCGA